MSFQLTLLIWPREWFGKIKGSILSCRDLGAVAQLSLLLCRSLTPNVPTVPDTCGIATNSPPDLPISPRLTWAPAAVFDVADLLSPANPLVGRPPFRLCPFHLPTPTEAANIQTT